MVAEHVILDNDPSIDDSLDDYQDIQGHMISDQLTLASALPPYLVETRPSYVTVDLHSELWLGKAIADFYRAGPKYPTM